MMRERAWLRASEAGFVGPPVMLSALKTEGRAAAASAASRPGMATKFWGGRNEPRPGTGSARCASSWRTRIGSWSVRPARLAWLILPRCATAAVRGGRGQVDDRPVQPFRRLIVRHAGVVERAGCDARLAWGPKGGRLRWIAASEGRKQGSRTSLRVAVTGSRGWTDAP